MYMSLVVVGGVVIDCDGALCVCVYLCMCVRESAVLLGSLAPTCLLGSIPPTLLMQSANTSLSSRDRRGWGWLEEGGRAATPAVEHLLIFFFSRSVQCFSSLTQTSCFLLLSHFLHGKSYPANSSTV